MTAVQVLDHEIVLKTNSEQKSKQLVQVRSGMWKGKVKKKYLVKLLTSLGYTETERGQWTKLR